MTNVPHNYCETTTVLNDTTLQPCYDSFLTTPFNNMGVTDEELRKFINKAHSRANAHAEQIVISNKKAKFLTIRKPTNGHIAFVDWVNVTFDLHKYYAAKFTQGFTDDNEYETFCRIVASQMSELIECIFGSKFKVTVQNNKGRNFYQYSFAIGENGKLGNFCIGGQRDTAMIMITGTGCALALPNWEERLNIFLNHIQGKITRIDLAHDDMTGTYINVDRMDEFELKGGFHCGGQQPNVEHKGNWRRPTGKGRTLAVGQRSSGKYMRCYEKGKKEGDKHSMWTRLEVELKTADRVIPLDVLTDPSSYFLGSYPCVAEIFEDFTEKQVNRITTNKKTAEVHVHHAFNWIKHQTGKYLTYFSKYLSPRQILQLLSSDNEDDVPDRLFIPNELSYYQLEYKPLPA